MSHHVYHRLSSRQKRGRGAGHKSRLDVRQDRMGTVDDREKNFEELDLLPRLEIIRYNLKHFVECVRHGVGPSFDAETSTACVSRVT